LFESSVITHFTPGDCGRHYCNIIPNAAQGAWLGIEEMGVLGREKAFTASKRKVDWLQGPESKARFLFFISGFQKNTVDSDLIMRLMFNAPRIVAL